MDEAWFLPLWLQLVIAVGFLAVLGAGAWFMARLLLGTLRSGGGWSQLAAAYPTTQPMPAQHMSGQTVQVGSVVYKRCVDLAVTDAGLHLQLTGIAALGSSTAVLIPWPDFAGIAPARLFWEPAHTLTVGRPMVATLCVREPLYQAMRVHLPEMATAAS